MRLYDIAADYVHVIEGGFIFNDDGEILFDSENLDELEAELEDKIEATALYYKNLDAEQTAIENEIKALQKRKDTLANKKDRLKKYTLACMQMADMKKLETSKVALSTRKSSSVVIYDENKLKQIAPQVFVEQEPKLNKTLLKKVLADTHGALDSCAAIQENINLQIK